MSFLRAIRHLSWPFFRMTLTTRMRMVSWLIALSGHCSRDDNVLIVCYYGTDCSGRHLCPLVAVKFSCAQSAQKGRHFRTRGTPKTGSERAGLRLMTEMVQLPWRRLGYGLKPSGMLLELELTYVRKWYRVVYNCVWWGKSFYWWE